MQREMVLKKGMGDLEVMGIDVPETLVGGSGVYKENPCTKYHICHGAITLYYISRDALWQGLC